MAKESGSIWLIRTVDTGRICLGVDAKGEGPWKWNTKLLNGGTFP